MASVRKERLPATAIRQKCPWCGEEDFFVDPVSRRTWHPTPACKGYLNACRTTKTTCLGFARLTNLSQFRKKTES
jgi:hypothetical protein